MAPPRPPPVAAVVFIEAFDEFDLNQFELSDDIENEEAAISSLSGSDDGDVEEEAPIFPLSGPHDLDDFDENDDAQMWFLVQVLDHRGADINTGDFFF